MSPIEDLHAAVRALTRCAVRWGDAHGGADPATGVERGWFLGAVECADYLAVAAGADLAPAFAFGGAWPIVITDDWLIAPAMPLVLVGPGGDGVDASYIRRDDAVFREAAGREEPFLTSRADASPPGEPFDLLWFGDSERYTVRGGRMTVEDIFARLELPTDLAWIERHLIRGRRVEPGVLEGVADGGPGSPATMTVNRDAALHESDSWRDPEKFLRARADIVRTKRDGGMIVVHLATGAVPRFDATERQDGWSLVLKGGDYPLTGLSMTRSGTSLRLTATLHPTIDPLLPGMRGRLAFDLRSDLVALGTS